MERGIFLDQLRRQARLAPFTTYLERLLRRLGFEADPCPEVVGMSSVRKLRLLQAAVAALPANGSECYLEVGSFQGKSLIGALLPNPGRLAVACDDFSLFDDPQQPRNRAILESNLRRHKLEARVRFYDTDFRDLLARWSAEMLPPVGVYFYDGAHDEVSQYDGIRLIEPVLAPEAIILVDDWRNAADSESYAQAGTKRAVAESTHTWTLEAVLPARFNGDRDLWWNGIAVYSFTRSTSKPVVG